MHHDFCVIGGGIVGLATAYALQNRHPGASIVLVEKEKTFASHQSGHNSGVVHAGVYYEPGSLKASLCRKGAIATEQFCEQHGIAFERRGKLIVAISEDEMGRMSALQAKAEANGLRIFRLGAEELREREPNITGVGALFVPSTGIADYKGICKTLGQRLVNDGAEVLMQEEVTAITEMGNAVEVRTRNRAVMARHVVVCAGVQADRLARLSGLKIDFRIVPFRGEYYSTAPERAASFQHLIYPVPDPALPFLGVHFTPTVDGHLTIGPNAVLGFAREGYRKFSLNPKDMGANIAFGGLWRLAASQWKFGLEELRDSLWTQAYLDKCRKYWPSLKLADLRPWPAGIRAQAVTQAGAMVHDFLFVQSSRVLHVCNAPSPAATSALPIGELIVSRIDEMRGMK